MNAVGANQKIRSEKAKLSLIFSLLSWLIPLLAGNILAVVFGLMALKEIRANPQLQGKKMAQWGIAIGIISIPLEFLFVILFLYLHGGH
jgi:hypothetical protein